MPRRPRVRAHLQVERHGITVAFQSVPVEHIGSVLDQVLRDLGALERVHDLTPPAEVVQIGGYHPVEVPEDDEGYEEAGPVIGFTPPAPRPR